MRDDISVVVIKLPLQMGETPTSVNSSAGELAVEDEDEVCVIFYQ
jgi:hypothetical protein